MLERGDLARFARHCLRLALHRSDYPLRIQLEFQLADLPGSKQVTDPGTPPQMMRLAQARSDLRSLLGDAASEKVFMDEYLAWETSRRVEIDGASMLNAAALGDLEIKARALIDLYDQETPRGLTPIDAGYARLDREKMRELLMAPVLQHRTVLGQVQDLLEKRLIDAEAQIRAGETGASVLEQARELIVQDLARIAPDALMKIDAAEEALRRGDSESLSQALTSCRRAIKALADAVYPATDAEVIGIDAKPRRMSDDAYMNRLVQFVSEKLRSRASDTVVKGIVLDTSRRISSLNSLANKGVHDEVTVADARLAVTALYLVFGDVVRIHAGTYHLDE